jgi:hypothetical protein
VPLDAAGYVRSQALAAALDNLGVHELSVDDVPPAAAVIELGVALARGAIGPSELLERARLPGLRWREIPEARHGLDAEKVDPQLFVAAQVALAIVEAERLDAGDPSGSARRGGGEGPQPPFSAPWSWAGGVSIVRRLERALGTDRSTTARVLETAPGTWTAPRRAVAAAFEVMNLLGSVEASAWAQRAAGHAALGLALQGLAERGGAPVDAVAGELRERMTAAPIAARTGVDPHRLRVCTIVHMLAERANDDQLPILAPIRIAYEMARRRCPERVGFDLSRVDLLAHAVQEMRAIDSSWIRALVFAAGTVPPGTRVQLPDGRVGVALDASQTGDPLRPNVLVDGEVVTPATPVSILSAATPTHRVGRPRPSVSR